MPFDFLSGIGEYSIKEMNARMLRSPDPNPHLIQKVDSRIIVQDIQVMQGCSQSVFG